jgi:hypothetical protein
MPISPGCFTPFQPSYTGIRISPAHFSLLSPSAEVAADNVQDDDAMMLAAEGITGGTRYGPAD